MLISKISASLPLDRSSSYLCALGCQYLIFMFTRKYLLPAACIGRARYLGIGSALGLTSHLGLHQVLEKVQTSRSADLSASCIHFENFTQV